LTGKTVCVGGEGPAACRLVETASSPGDGVGATGVEGAR
jgi:hypothetical protein